MINTKDDHIDMDLQSMQQNYGALLRNQELWVLKVSIRCIWSKMTISHFWLSPYFFLVFFCSVSCQMSLEMSSNTPYHAIMARWHFPHFNENWFSDDLVSDITLRLWHVIKIICKGFCMNVQHLKWSSWHGLAIHAKALWGLVQKSVTMDAQSGHHSNFVKIDHLQNG